MSSLEMFSSLVLNKSDSQDPKNTEQKNTEQKNMEGSRITTESSRMSSIYERCRVCSKKVMSHSKCKCSNFYCGKHLHQHECTFSHFNNHKTLLEKKNIKVESDKIVRL